MSVEVPGSLSSVSKGFGYCSTGSKQTSTIGLSHSKVSTQKPRHRTKNMSSADPPKPSKRKWDQPAPGEDGTTSKVAKTDDSRTASEAAAAAAAIAAKIAAQFANGALGTGDKDHDAEFTHDIDINDVRNRYLLTRGSTQDQVVFFSPTIFQAV